MMSYNPYGDPLDRYGFVMVELSTPEVRLEAIAELGFKWEIDLTKPSDSRFQAWGITREQARAAIEAGERK